MKLLLLSILICFQANAELVSLEKLELRYSDAWRSFQEKRKSTPEYEAIRKKTGNPSRGYDIALCNKEKDFTACDLAHCITGSKKEANDRWLNEAQKNVNGTCYLPDVENTYRNILNIVKECVTYYKQKGRIDPTCRKFY